MKSGKSALMEISLKENVRPVKLYGSTQPTLIQAFPTPLLKSYEGQAGRQHFEALAK